MKLEEVWIERYGPLQKKMELGEDMHIVRGPNESGKSLLVEALLKKFTNGSVSNPRLNESPEGFVVVSDGTEEYKIGEGESLVSYYEDLYSREVNEEELKNIFVIRNGDVTINDEDEFYSRVTDKITGRRTKDIQRIREELLEEGRLTPGRQDIADNKRHNKAESQLEEAESLKQDIEDYLEDAQEIQETEAKLFQAKRKNKSLKKKKSNLEDAKEVADHQELAEKKDEAEEDLQELEKLPSEQNLSDLERRSKNLDEESGERNELLSQKKDQLRLAKLSVGGSAATFLLFLVGVFLQTSLLNALGILLPLGLLVYAFLMYRNWNETSSRLSELDKERERILSDAEKMGISAEDVPSLRRKISDIESEREQYDNQFNQHIGVLKQELGVDGDSRRELLNQAENRLEEEEEELPSVDLKFDESELRETKRELDELSIDEMKQDLEEHNKKLQEFSERAHQLKFSTFTGDDLDLEINSLGALDDLTELLEDFIYSIERDAEISRVAYEVFGEMQEVEKQETADLFEEGSRATKLFNELTDDRYETVTYDGESNEVLVKRGNGAGFTPSELSDGTRDQLYFSIRVALGEEILQDDAGFFVLDDAFLTSDPQRLKKQRKMLGRMMEDGWQIIYLTSKDGTVSTLSELSDSEVIELDRLE